MDQLNLKNSIMLEEFNIS